MGEGYYEMFFPMRDRKVIMKQQILIAECVNGFSPDITDDMEYSEFLEWYNIVCEMYENEEDAE